VIETRERTREAEAPVILDRAVHENPDPGGCDASSGHRLGREEMHWRITKQRGSMKQNSEAV